MFSTKLLLIFGIIAYMGHSVQSLRCYVCSEAEKKFQKSCDDDDLEPHELESLKTDCNNVTQIIPIPTPNSNYKLQATGCVEIIGDKSEALPPTKGDNQEVDKKITIRTCYFGNPDNIEKECQLDSGTMSINSLKGKLECNVCEEDLCNSSTINHPILFGVFLSLFIAYFTNKFA